MRSIQYLFHKVFASFLLVSLCGLVGCGPGAYRWHSPNSDQSGSDVEANQPAIHNVKRGETLYSIAWQKGLNFKQLAEWNNISPPYAIYPGDQLRLQGVSAPKSSRQKRPNIASRLASWVWPHGGKVVANFGAKVHQRSGVDIQTKPQDDVYAVADGQVVFAGKLNNYGLVLIVEHRDNLFSMLAYNQRLLSQQGERIKKGQVVAKSGRSGDGESRLHFEIRHKAEPLDVVANMPKRQ